MAVILILGMLLSVRTARCLAPAAEARLLKRRRPRRPAKSRGSACLRRRFHRPDHLDPAVVYEFGGTLIVGNVYETLVSFNPGDPTLIPVLAESWDVTEEGDNWLLTFNLDSDATFASGSGDGGRCRLLLEYAIDINLSPAFLLTDVCAMTTESTTAVDAATVELRIPQTVSPQVCLSVLTFTTAAVIEKPHSNRTWVRIWASPG